MKVITLIAVLAAAFAGSAPNKPTPPVERPKGIIVIYMFTDEQSLLFRPPPEKENVTEVFSL